MTIGVFLPEGIEAEVCVDISRRAAMGLEKYGVTVADNPLNLREWLTQVYEYGGHPPKMVYVYHQKNDNVVRS